MSPSTDPSPSSPTIEQRARRRVALKKGFLIHALVFVLVNAGLYLFWLLGSSGASGGWGMRHGGGHFLPLWGWGLGLTIHGIVVFIRLQGEGVTQRMVDREIEAIKRREGSSGG